MVKTFAIHLAAVVSGWVANPLPPRAQVVVDGFLQKRRATEDNATRQISFRTSTKQTATPEMLPVSWLPRLRLKF